jgi:predicted N-acyltransferase
MRRVRVVERIGDIPRRDWDDLEGGNVLASHGWLRTVEQTGPGHLSPRYFLLEDDGRLVAGTACYRIGGAEASKGLDTTLFGRLEKFADIFGISFNPHVLCRPYRTIGAHILVHRDLEGDSARAAMGEVLTAVEREAFNQNLPVVISAVLDSESDLMEVLKGRGYHRTISSPVNIVDLNCTSFEEYLKSLDSFSPNARKVVRREMNKNKKEGVTIEEVKNPDDYGDRLYDLLCGNTKKYRPEPFPFNKSFLRSLKANLGEEVRIYAASKNGMVTGVSVDFQRNGCQFNPYVGVDHDSAGNDFTYFNLAYYHPVKIAVGQGIRRLIWGVGFYNIKTRRGARIHNSYIFYKSPVGMRHLVAGFWFKFHSVWWRKKLANLNNGRPRRARKARLTKGTEGA